MSVNSTDSSNINMGLSTLVLGALPKFQGEDPISFFKSFERRKNIEGWSDQRAIQLCALSCVGKAERFLNSHPELELCESYNQFKHAIVDEFQITQSEACLHAALAMCKQTQSQSVREYARVLMERGSDLERASSNLNQSAIRSMVLSFFLQGLLPTYQRIMATQDFNDITQAIKVAERLETAENRIVASSQIEQPKVSHNKCFKCGKGGHMSQRCPLITCFQCGKRGHTKRFCRQVSVTNTGYATPYLPTHFNVPPPPVSNNPFQQDF